MIRKMLITCSLLTLIGCLPAPEPTAEVQGAIAPAVCDAFDDNVGATPSNAVDVTDIYGYGFRFTAINLDTAYQYYSPFDHATAGSGTWIWICEQDALTIVNRPCRHNAQWGTHYTSDHESTGIPGSDWFPCWKANTTSHFRRALPGQTITNISAAFASGYQTSILVTNAWLPDPPLCPYRAGVSGATVPNSWQSCGTISDSGRAEYILTSSTGAKVTGLWPTGQTGAPCIAWNANGTSDVVAVYNCPVEPRTHYDY